MSKYEEIRVNGLIYEIISKEAIGLSKQDCPGECWIVYLENKATYMGRPSFWEDIAECFVQRMKELRKERNHRCKNESKFSFDQKYGDFGTSIEARESLRQQKMPFDDRIALVDYERRLGKEKEQVMRFMEQRETPEYIMEKMGFSKTEYERLRKELEKDMIRYQKL